MWGAWIRLRLKRPGTDQVPKCISWTFWRSSHAEYSNYIGPIDGLFETSERLTNRRGTYPYSRLLTTHKFVSIGVQDAMQLNFMDAPNVYGDIIYRYSRHTKHIGRTPCFYKRVVSVWSHMHDIGRVFGRGHTMHTDTLWQVIRLIW